MQYEESFFGMHARSRDRQAGNACSTTMAASWKIRGGDSVDHVSFDFELCEAEHKKRDLAETVV